MSRCASPPNTPHGSAARYRLSSSARKYLRALDITEAWRYSRGHNIKVAVSDSGVRPDRRPRGQPPAPVIVSAVDDGLSDRYFHGTWWRRRPQPPPARTRRRRQVTSNRTLARAVVHAADMGAQPPPYFVGELHECRHIIEHLWRAALRTLPTTKTRTSSCRPATSQPSYQQKTWWSAHQRCRWARRPGLVQPDHSSCYRWRVSMRQQRISPLQRRRSLVRCSARHRVEGFSNSDNALINAWSRALAQPSTAPVGGGSASSAVVAGAGAPPSTGMASWSIIDQLVQTGKTPERRARQPGGQRHCRSRRCTHPVDALALRGDLRRLML